MPSRASSPPQPTGALLHCGGAPVATTLLNSLATSQRTSEKAITSRYVKDVGPNCTAASHQLLMAHLALPGTRHCDSANPQKRKKPAQGTRDGRHLRRTRDRRTNLRSVRQMHTCTVRELRSLSVQRPFAPTTACTLPARMGSSLRMLSRSSSDFVFILARRRQSV